MPFKRYVVSCQTDVLAPKYLRQKNPPKYDLSALNKQTTDSSTSKRLNVPISTSSLWPEVEDLCLDESQLKAMKTALTTEFAIIQGPPGTGKTFVGLKIVQILLKNKSVWGANRPILVVCYTNHALDQFLEGMLNVGETRFCRVGGQSKSKLLEDFTLRSIKQRKGARKKKRKAIYQGLRDCCKEMDNLKES